MKTLHFAAFALLASAAAHAGNTATQTVTFSVSAIIELAVSGNPGALAVSGAAAGSNPTTAMDATTSDWVTANQTGQKITGAINTAMPADTTLALTLGTLPGATSAGAVNLTTTATNLVTGISTRAHLGNATT